jgi:4-amino-4-deoxy-L-arabinose transferase-like glycosyltransferase
LLVCGAVVVVLLVVLLVPWLRANPPLGLTKSQTPYADEGLYNLPARNFVMFGSFGRTGQFLQLTNSAYALLNSLVFRLTGPSIVAARVVSLLSMCGMVLAVLWGLWKPCGRATALVVAAGIAGSQLILSYAHLAIVEPFELFMLVAAFVAMTRALANGKPSVGIVSGVLLAVAVAAKANALLVVPGLIGVPLVGSLLERNRRRFLAGVSAVSTFVILAVVWLVTVAVPNWSDLRAGMNTLNGTTGYPHSVGGVVTTLYAWLGDRGASDDVMRWTYPLLIACVAGLVCSILLRRRCSNVHRYVTVSGLVWAGVAWALPAASSYNPNRYFLIAIPGLALAAGPGLGALVEWAMDRTHRPQWTVLAASGLALLLAAPGVISYLTLELPVLGTDTLARDQKAISAHIPKNAVVYGLYAANMAFSSHVHMVTPWPHSGLHMTTPIEHYGVQYVIVDIGKHQSPIDSAILRAVKEPGVKLGTPVTVVDWGPRELALYRVTKIRTESKPSTHNAKFSATR